MRTLRPTSCRTFLLAVVAWFLILPLAGCNTERDRGINKDRDKPRAPATEKPG
jgi:hypothetical protein